MRRWDTLETVRIVLTLDMTCRTWGVWKPATHTLDSTGMTSAAAGLCLYACVCVCVQVPRWNCKETFLLLTQVAVLVSRTMLSLRIARLGGDGLQVPHTIGLRLPFDPERCWTNPCIAHMRLSSKSLNTMSAGGVVYAGGATAIVARVRGGVERLFRLRAERRRGELRAQVPHQLHHRRIPPAPHPVRVPLRPATFTAALDPLRCPRAPVSSVARCFQSGLVGMTFSSIMVGTHVRCLRARKRATAHLKSCLASTGLQLTTAVLFTGLASRAELPCTVI
jgi:hypothetical protein